MNKIISIHEAKAYLSQYVQGAKAGKPVGIGRNGKLEMMLVAANPKPSRVKFGTLDGQLRFTDNDVMGLDQDIQAMTYDKDAVE